MTRDEDEPKYIDADMAHIIAHDGINVKLKDEPKTIDSKVKIAAESVTKPQLSKEQIKNYLRSLLTKVEHSDQHGTINICSMILLQARQTRNTMNITITYSDH